MTCIGENQTAIFVRHRKVMQSFMFTVQQIPGSKIRPADYLNYKYFENDPAAVLATY